MAVKTILCPVVMSTRQTPSGRQNTGWRPSLHALSLTLPGRTKGAAVLGVDPGGLHSMCPLTIWADEFSFLDQHPDAIDFGGVPQTRLSSYLQHLESFPFNSHPRMLDITAKAIQIGLTRSLIGKSVAGVLREFLVHLDPIASDDMYERETPAIRETITDDFNRASLDAGWAASLGTIWVINGSVTARPVDNFAYTTVKRSEASFPDNQYAQCDTEYATSGGDNSQGGVMARCSSSVAFYSAKIGNVNYLELNKNSTSDYIADSAITLAADTLVTLRLTCTGTTITVHTAGVQRISVSDSSHASGVPGMWGFTGAPPLEDHDNFECTDALGVGDPALSVLIGEPIVGSSIF